MLSKLKLGVYYRVVVVRTLSPLVVASSLVVIACGGQSLEHSDDGDSGQGGSGNATNGGTGSGGASGASGSFSGGSSGASFGGTSFGGTSFGGTSSGGSSVGGSSIGGSSTGGVAGTSGTAGAGGICSLPLVTGACDAYFPSFGFSQVQGRCVPFIYGGCEGNENRFSTLAECEAKCGGTVSDCPSEMPPRDFDCPVPSQVCTYDFEGCLCTPQATYSCPKVDPTCTPPPPDAGVSPIVVAVYYQCTCELTGWACGVVTVGGR
jgi:hypothetical protein